jgi:hypothetical protein
MCLIKRQSGRCGEEKNCLTLPRIELQFLNCQTCSLVAVPTEVPRDPLPHNQSSDVMHIEISVMVFFLTLTFITRNLSA